MNSIILHICLVCLQNLYVLCRIKYIWMEILRQRSLKISIPKRSFMRWETFSQFPAVSRREQIKIWSWQKSKGSALQIMIFQEVHKAIKLYISAEINEIPILLCYKPELWSSLSTASSSLLLRSQVSVLGCACCCSEPFLPIPSPPLLCQFTLLTKCN